MSVMRFVGANSREAMRQVREALGDEALILANRRVEQGVEILAMAESGTPQPEAPARPATSTASATPRQAQGASTQVGTVQPGAMSPGATSPGQDPAQAFEAMSARLLEEMRDMRALLTRGQGPAGEQETCRDALARQLEEAGFAAALAAELVSTLPEELALDGAANDQVQAWLQRQLVQRLHALGNEGEFLDHAGIVALIGPTGVGKTTTTAKLAARYVKRHGTRPVALVTTDSFRIGAHEQLRIYSRLLDVPMYALNADQPVSDLLERMRGKSWVIIDTVGMSQRDQRVIEQVSHLRGASTPVRLVLMLNAASQPETLEEVVVRYRQATQAAGAELTDCIITKQDEAGRLGPVLDIILRHGLRLLFVSHGQRVPEDMSLAAPDSLVHLALSQRRPVRGAGSRQAAAPAATRQYGLLSQGRRVAVILRELRRRLVGFEHLEAGWDLLGLPPSVQQQRLDALCAKPSPLHPLGVMWSERAKVAGEAWAMPDVALDHDGAWSALPWLQHRQPPGLQARLAAARAQGASLHLLRGLPDAEAGAWLEREGLAWCSLVRGGQRVVYAGEKQPLAALAGLGEPMAQRDSRYRGAPCRLHLARLPVTLALKGSGRRGDELTAQAWLGELRDGENDQLLARRFWLAPARLGNDLEPLLVTQLQSDALPQLARRAWQQLTPAELGEVRADLRLLLAGGLATVALQLDLVEDDSARDLRAELLGLAGGRQRRRDSALLGALVQLFLIRDAIRQLGFGERETG